MSRIGRPPVAPEQRFFTRVQQAGDCWRWTGGNTRGYGVFWDGARNVKAHRWTYEFFRAEIPVGLELDHECRNPWCVNPWHLEPVTTEVNVQREKAALTTCTRGHPLVNVGGAQRICRVCRRDTHARHRARKGASA